VLRAELVTLGDIATDWRGNRNPWYAFLDAAAAGKVLQMRTRRSGDRFCPLGMGGHSVKVADFLTNQKVPRVLRDRIPLLEGERGLLWVCGQRPDHRARIRDDTEWVLVLRFLRDQQ
jgi:tRNA(Ile)-lysidine synthase